MKKYDFPKVWPGYILGALFILFEIIYVLTNPNAVKEPMTWWSVLLWLIGLVYWCVCVYKIHKAILEMTDNHYPISPARAVGFMFIPFYNLYWIFKWPGEIVSMVNTRVGEKKRSLWVPGVILLVSSLLGRAIDGSIWLFAGFGVLGYLIRSLKKCQEKQEGPVPYKDTTTKLSTGAIIAIVVIVSVLFISLLAAVAIPTFISQRGAAEKAFCISNMNRIRTAEQAWAIDINAVDGAKPAKKDLVPAYLQEWPTCKEKEYQVPAVGENPVCPNNIPGHSLE